MKRTTTAGKSRKSHKSRKTTPHQESAGRPSSTELATTPPPVLLLDHNPLQGVLQSPPKEGDSVQGVATPVPQENPKDQWWYRPPDSKARKLAEKIVVMRAAGHDDKSVAKKLKTTEGSVRQYVYIARKNGWLDDNDEPVDLEAELALNIERKVVRNIGASLDGQMTNWQTHEMTIAAAKGRGIFKSHEKVEGETNAMPVVAIQVIMPPVGAEDQLPRIAEDQMGGVPAYIEGDVFDVDTRQALEAGQSSTGPEAAVGTKS